MVTISNIKAVWVAAALGLVAGCGGGNEAAPADEAEAKAAAVVAAADPCAGEGAGQLQDALCKDAEIAPLIGEIKSNLSDAAQALSKEGAQALAEDQTSWLETTRTACGVKSGAAIDETAQQCLRAAFATRAKEAKDAIRREGGFVFRTAEINRAFAVPEETAVEYGVPEGVPAAVEKRIRFPRLDGDTPQIRKFNRLMEQQSEAPADDQTSEYVDYEIGYAGPELVSVRFNRSDMMLGAARPSNAAKVVTVVMASGEPLTAADVFSAPESQWKSLIVDKARRGLVAQLREMGASIDLPDNDIADTATKIRNWLITDQALVIVFPPESIGPHALGDLQVAIPWGELKDVLNPNGPGPIGAQG